MESKYTNLFYLAQLEFQFVKVFTQKPKGYENPTLVLSKAARMQQR